MPVLPPVKAQVQVQARPPPRQPPPTGRRAAPRRPASPLRPPPAPPPTTPAIPTTPPTPPTIMPGRPSPPPSSPPCPPGRPPPAVGAEHGEEIRPRTRPSWASRPRERTRPSTRAARWSGSASSAFSTPCKSFGFGFVVLVLLLGGQFLRSFCFAVGLRCDLCFAVFCDAI